MQALKDGNQFGKYQIVRLLGRGGMAEVYEAEDTQLGRVVAVKVLPESFSRDTERVKRFQKEVRASATLDHPNIVPVFEVGEQDGIHYYTMSLLPQGDLKNRLRGGALDPVYSLQVLREIAVALAYAHDKGFVHRDVKPENILFRDSGSAVLTDFGIARAIDSGTRMTATGLSIGTPRYMSPEQARGHDVDGRSDFYALGVVFHEMLTGRVPYDAEDSFAVAYKHINDPLPELPPALSKFQPVINRLLAKVPADRYQNGAELLEILSHLEQGKTLFSDLGTTRLFKQPSIQKKSMSSDPGSQAPDRVQKLPPSKNRYKSWVLGGTVLTAMLGVGIYFWKEQHVSPQSNDAGTRTESRPVTQLTRPEETQMGSQEILPPKSETASFKTGSLHITTTPVGAEVFLNEQRLGLSPLHSDELPAGEHRLRVLHRYYEPWEQTIHLESEMIERINAELQRGSGRLEVVSNPPGAEVWIDGKPESGSTPLTVSDLRSGDQTVELRLPRYRTETHSVEILPGETAQLNLRLDGGDLYEWGGRWFTGEEIVVLLLESAEADLAANRLMRPESDNAWEKYQQVLKINPESHAAKQGIDRIAERYLELAEVALENKQLDRAENFIANARATGAEGSDLDYVLNLLQEAQNKHEREQAANRPEMDDVQSRDNQSLSRNPKPLDRPQPEYPQECLSEASVLETVIVEFDLTAEGVAINPRVTDTTNECFNSNALSAVNRWRYHPHVVDGQNKPQSGLKTALDFRAMDRDAYPKTRTEPNYPRRCQLRASNSETVVVEFDVTRTGEVANAKVIRSTNSCFNDAALQAVSLWEYHPRLVQGEPQRVLGLKSAIDFSMR